MSYDWIWTRQNLSYSHKSSTHSRILFLKQIFQQSNSTYNESIYLLYLIIVTADCSEPKDVSAADFLSFRISFSDGPFIENLVRVTVLRGTFFGHE